MAPAISPGLHWIKASEKWMVRVEVGEKQVCIGLFETIGSAVRAYTEAVNEKTGAKPSMVMVRVGGQQVCIGL